MFIHLLIFHLCFIYRLGTERLLSNPKEPLNPLKAVPTPVLAITRRENLDPAERTTFFCPQCSENYEKELAKLTAIQMSFSEATLEASQPSLPLWLRNAKLNTIDAKIADLSQVCFYSTVKLEQPNLIDKGETNVVFHIFTGEGSWTSF